MGSIDAEPCKKITAQISYPVIGSLPRPRRYISITGTYNGESTMAEEEIVPGDNGREKREIKDVKKMKDFIDESEVKSDFFLERDVTLHSATAKRLFKRVFEHMQTQATAAILLTRKFGLRELSDKNVEKIDGAFNQLTAEMNRDMAFANKILEDIGVKNAAMTPDAVALTVKVTCPQGMDVLNLILRLDMLAMKLKTLWMMHELPLSNTEDRVHSWQVRIFKACDAVRALGQQAYIEADKKKQSDAEKIEKGRVKQVERRNTRSNEKPTQKAEAKVSSESIKK
tara:strand:+ start:703 stop:1554 length:852 start_codon:yes stop_codon:yes gene_type:complete